MVRDIDDEELGEFFFLPEEAGCRALASAVLTLAAKDLRRRCEVIKSADGRRQCLRNRRSAWLFLTGRLDPEALALWCELLDIDPEAVSRKARSLKGAQAAKEG